MAIDRDAIAQDAAATMSRYVQFDTTNPPGSERAAAEWLRAQLCQRGISDDVTLLARDEARPIVVGRVAGSQPRL